MGTLLLRLCEPSKSGVIGLLCAALGRSRGADISEMASLEMGVRIDWPGTLERDYHTSLDVAKAGGGIKPCEPSNRFYLADACFLVALNGESRFLEQIQQALITPVWQIYLGRKSFVSGAPVFLKDGLRPDDDIGSALRNYPYLCRRRRNPPESLRLELEDDNGEQVKTDQPFSFAERRFGLRHLKTAWVNYRDLPAVKEDICTCPD
jgi:CRISPR system Cascade subunit CasD